MANEKVNIALIPARYGSQRIPLKNIKLLNGIPLIAYTIQSALKSNVFKEIIVSTDHSGIAKIATDWGASVPELRPAAYSGNLSPDLEWVMHAVNRLVKSKMEEIDCLAILRPTSPLRTPSTIRNAMQTFNDNQWADSLRAMEVTHLHPGKMWRVDSNYEASPYLDQSDEITPTHNLPTQSLERVWVQNASLEITRLRSLMAWKSISGKRVLAYEMPGFEGFDLNNPVDWKFLEFLAQERPEIFPHLQPQGLAD